MNLRSAWVVNAMRIMSERLPAFVLRSAVYLRLMERMAALHGMEADSRYFALIADLRESGREPDDRESRMIRDWWHIRYPEILRRAERHRTRAGRE